MSERSDDIRFYLYCPQMGEKLVGEIKDYKKIQGDTYTLEDEGYFRVDKKGKLVFYEQGYNYLMKARLTYGASVKVWVRTEVKDDSTMEQNWKVISNLKVNMYTLVFNEEQDNPSVECETVPGGDLKMFEEGFDDEFDVVGPNAPELPYVNLRLDPRSIIKRSRFITSDVEVSIVADSGLTAKAVPLELDYSSENFIGEVSNTNANSVGGDYADLTTAGNCIITTAPRDLIYTFDGRVGIYIPFAGVNGSSLRMDLVRYSGGSDTEYSEIIQPMGSINPASGNDLTLVYDFNDLEVVVNEGDSIGIMILTDAEFFRIRSTDDTDLKLSTDTPYPATVTKAVKPFDMFKHLGKLISGDDSYPFESSVFGPGGRHEDKLLVHGTWLRNMPQILNEGEEDERRLQANLSAEELFEAYSILEPLRFDVVEYNGKQTFTVGAFKDIQQNFTGVRIGQTEGSFELIEVSDKKRNLISENHFRTVKIGSTTSGSNYGQVNNLYSTSGHCEWKTIHKEGEGEYEVTTEFRTGAEDIELQRQFQYVDNPDIDGEYDDDWFIVDAVWDGEKYVVKDWTYYYEVIPTKVYSAQTNYNWCFTPIEMLRGHGYKINAGLVESPNEYLKNPTGNCTLSLITKRPTEQEITANEPFPHSLLEKPRIKLMMVNFKVHMNQEIIDQLRGATQGVDNKFGLVEILYNGSILKGRLFEASTDTIGEFKIIQAVV